LLGLLACGRGRIGSSVAAPGVDLPPTDGGAAAQPPLPADAGDPPPPNGDGGGQPAATSCIASPILSDLGTKQRLLVGADMSESVAELAPFDIRYLYLAGGLADGSGPCASCGSSCTAGGVTCSASSGVACGWWGCWQDPSLAPGQYLRDHLRRTQASGQIPLISYYQLLQTS